MGLEVIMKQEVGDGLDAVEATGIVLSEADNWQSDLFIHVLIPVINPDPESVEVLDPDEYHKDDFVDPAGDDDALALEVETFLATIGALAVVRTLNSVEVKTVEKSRASNDILITTNYPTALVITALTGGRDESEAVDMELILDDDDKLVLKVDGNLIFNTPFHADSFENDEPFERNLTHWLKKTRC